jgi:asparagine synthase (glutamine-hydrolysing)
MIELAQQVPAELKMLRRKGERPVEKWVLRKACEDLLPADILWRDKEQFDEGSGTVDIVAECAASYLSADEARTYITEHPVAELRSQEEAAYHKLLTEAYDQPEQVLCNVARWTDRPDDLYEPVGS